MLRPRPYITPRLTLTEAMYLMDVLDIWIDGYKDTADEAENNTEVSELMGQMDIGMSVRSKLFRKLRRWL